MFTHVHVPACSPSNTNIVIDAQVPGVISSPIFPDGSTDSSCIWKIQAADNFRLAITIEVLKLNGVDDYLVIRDGADALSPLIGKYGPCANGSLTLYSSGSSAFLQTVSATFSVNDKLRITYKPIESDTIECSHQGGHPANLCGTNTGLKGLSGVIASPNFPNNYDAKETCVWTIDAPPGYRVQFTIQWLGIEDHRYSRAGTCGDDSITVSESRGNEDSRDIIKLCGCQRLFSFVSYNERMFVRFDSFKKNNWPGFYATYRALTPEECPAGKTDCAQKNTGPIGFSAGGQVCTTSEIQVVCRPDYVEVSLQISDYPGIIVNDSSLHLEDKACGAGYKDAATVKFTFGLEDCKTEQEDDGKKIYYKNKLYLKAGQPSNDEAITRGHMQVIPFQCGYDKKINISKVSYNARSTFVKTDAEGFGNFTYFMDMYKDASNNERVTEFPKEVGLGQKMYFGFRVESDYSDLVVFPDVCKATASSSFDSTPVHLIIEDACSRDNTLEYQYGQKSQHNFSIAAFRFTEGYDDVYIHCQLTVCPANDDGTRCARGCQPSKRKRRSEEDMSANLYIGPLKPKIMTEEAAKEHSYAESDSGSSMVLIVGVLVGVLGTVAIGLIAAVIIISRRRNSSGNGASLIVAEE
ncbi:hypothetical protein OS493_031083 [Desmophyllum pertusum]|uniref:CUB and zona pellucida-like domain-containing protein 1 n=1 Tax=Desmophyllum pertusum TaxID=174260 RepID=A0A9X0CI09_9CNID|nr:hypothetical protein OS493_031083 [Desmophyllum pertusum]